MATQKYNHPHANGSNARYLAIVFICVVAILLLVISMLVESTPPFLILLPTIIAAIAIARLRFH